MEGNLLTEKFKILITDSIKDYFNGECDDGTIMEVDIREFKQILAICKHKKEVAILQKSW